MNSIDIIEILKSKNVLQFRKDNCFQILKEIKPYKEIDTHFVGKIVLFEVENEFIAMEEDGKSNYYLRIVKSKEDFDAFVHDRLSIYDRMWDGCGCKVEYTEIWEKNSNST